jgi:putative phosphoribosyl transferase
MDDTESTPVRRAFRDRRDAGRVLAQRLAQYRHPGGRDNDHDDVVVLGLARGGVTVGREVADVLGAPLEVCVVRKLAVPQWPELALGALGSGGARVVNADLLHSLGLRERDLDDAVIRETAELLRREHAYRADRGPLDLTGATVLLVDDGLATGASMLAAVRSVRGAGARRVVVAVPVGPASVCRRLRGEADDVVCAITPEDFRAVGEVYADFHQVSDDEVREALAAHH